MHELCRPLQLGESALDLVMPSVERRREVKRGERLYSEGEQLTTIFAVCSGSFKLVSRTENSRVLGFHLVGELMGVSGLHVGAYGSDAVALEKATVCALPIAVLEAIGGEVPSLHQRIISVLSLELYHTQRLKSMLAGRRNAEQQVAALFLCFSMRLAARDYAPEQFRLGMDRTDIGNYLGLAKETVSRVLTRFHDNEIITVKGKQVRALNQAALTDILATPTR